jgi:methylmalonyl-CoA/ethylmalonyl-CoA epimerase
MTMSYGGLNYKISQVSLVVRDIDTTMAAYHEAFGWGPWKVYDHVEPVHHDTHIDGEAVAYSLRGAEVMVGDMNFELLQPLSGPSKWQEFLDTKGEGIMSIAVMFDTVEESDKVKSAFADHGIGVTMSARIGDHIEYYYLDTESRFKAPIESGSGHALDFMKPAYTYPPTSDQDAAE